MNSSDSGMAFGEVLEAVERLTLDEQEELSEIVRRRLGERGRKRLIQEVAEARKEKASGGCQPATVNDLMREIQS